MNVVGAILFLLSGITVRGEDSSSSGPIANYTETIKYYNKCSFSAKNFNASCVQKSCPNLSGKCPYSNTTTGCAEVSSLLSQCLQQQQVICDLSLSQLPMCPMTVNLSGIVPIVGGQCVLTQGFTYGLDDVTFCVTGSGPSLSVSISAPNITSDATYVCTFLPFKVTSPALNLRLALEVAATVNLDLSTQPPTITDTTVDRSEISFTSSNFNRFVEIIIGELTKVVNGYFQTAGTDVAAINFLASYVAFALQGSDKNCVGSAGK